MFPQSLFPFLLWQNIKESDEITSLSDFWEEVGEDLADDKHSLDQKEEVYGAKESELMLRSMELIAKQSALKAEGSQKLMGFINEFQSMES